MSFRFNKCWDWLQEKTPEEREAIVKEAYTNRKANLAAIKEEEKSEGGARFNAKYSN